MADLIEGGLSSEDKTVVFVAAAEPEDATEGRLGQVVRWQWSENKDNEIEASWPDEATVGFFISDGRASQVDQIEAFKPWMKAQEVELGRVISVLYCQLVAQHDQLLAWYDACVYFSDIMLLNRRDGVANKWISDLKTRFVKKCMPCLVEMVKKGKVHNPALVLDLQACRMSHWFDEEEDAWAALVDSDTEIILQDDAEDDLGDELVEDVDIYLARHSSGRRVKEVPDITKFIS